MGANDECTENKDENIELTPDPIEDGKCLSLSKSIFILPT